MLVHVKSLRRMQKQLQQMVTIKSEWLQKFKQTNFSKKNIKISLPVKIFPAFKRVHFNAPFSR